MTGLSVESSGALGPRAADGSMPAVDFLKLAAGSQMIDKGTDVGLPFVGAAPDLGAYEYGAAAITGTGGASGTGGTGTGGITTTGTGGTTTMGTGGTGTVGTGGASATATGGSGGASRERDRRLGRRDRERDRRLGRRELFGLLVHARRLLRERPGGIGPGDAGRVFSPAFRAAATAGDRSNVAAGSAVLAQSHL